uniref:Gag-pol protein n=1 Tax=Solanum tuberosum TaxID=4113 RepID=M1DUQ3_SOLTU
MSFNNEEQSNNIHETERKTYNLRSKRCRRGKNVIDKGERQSTAISKTVKPKDCIEWTVDLRAKFKEATQRLGKGLVLELVKLKGFMLKNSWILEVSVSSCLAPLCFLVWLVTTWFNIEIASRNSAVVTSSWGCTSGALGCLPKEILEIMNVPGLTRMQVASYLQNIRDSSSIQPNGHGSEYDQVYSADQICAASGHSAKLVGIVDRVGDPSFSQVYRPFASSSAFYRSVALGDRGLPHQFVQQFADFLFLSQF